MRMTKRVLSIGALVSVLLLSGGGGPAEIGPAPACGQAGGTCCAEPTSTCYAPNAPLPEPDKFWRGDGRCCTCPYG